MINYSVFMMKNAYDSTKPMQAYAKNQVSEVWDLEQFSQHIASHASGFTRGTVRGVISAMCECLVEQILEGKKVNLGELGSFSASISCEGAENILAFKESNIKEVNINFSPGPDFENLVNRASFCQVASRAAQAATLRAEKKGLSTVDLAAAKAGNATSSDNDNTQTSGGSQDTGGSSTGDSDFNA